MNSAGGPNSDASAEFNPEGAPAEAAPVTDRLFRAIAGSAPTIIWMDDAAGRCIFLNKTWCEFTGR